MPICSECGELILTDRHGPGRCRRAPALERRPAMTPAERAAVERYPVPVPRNPLAFEDRERAAFVAGWNARPVLTEEQIFTFLLDRFGAYVLHDRPNGPVYLRSSARALLAQADVPRSSEGASDLNAGAAGSSSCDAMVDREALIGVIDDFLDDANLDFVNDLAGAILRIVRDAAEVRREQIERDAQIAFEWGQPRYLVSDIATKIADAIREQRS